VVAKLCTLCCRCTHGGNIFATSRD